MCVCAAMYWAGTGARRFPWPDDRRDPIRPVGSRLWETRSDSSGSVLAQFESRGGSEGVRSAPVRVRGRLYTWDAYGAAEGCLVVGVAQCGDQAFACNVEVRLPFLAVAARHAIPSLALPDLLNRLIDHRDFGVGQMDLAGIPVGTAKVVGKVRFGSIPCGRIRSYPIGEADSVPALALPAFLQIGSDGAPDLVIVRIHGCSLPKSFIRYYQLIPRSSASETADSDADGKIRTGGLPPRSQFSGHERGRFGVNGSLGKPRERDGTETEGYGHGYGSRHGVAHRAR